MTSTNNDIRWQQRFINFEKAFFRLEEALAQNSPNELERNGIVQRFKFTIELCWKVMKVYLEFNGFSFKPSPKETFRLVQSSGYMHDVQPLLDGLDIGNELSHDYDGEKFLQYEQEIRKNVHPSIAIVYHFLKSQVP